MFDWYILQVHSGSEKKVEKELLAQLEKKGLKKNIETILIPSEDVIEMKKGKKVNTERSTDSVSKSAKPGASTIGPSGDISK